MEFRHEWKHELSPGDLPALRSRLRAVAAPDSHGRSGVYQIRSLYFDTPTDRALREKIDGVARREKFRLRRYGGGSLIRLEKKSKLNGLCAKEQTPVTEEEVRALLSGDTDWMRSSLSPKKTRIQAELTPEAQKVRRAKARSAYTQNMCVSDGGVTIDLKQ